MNMKKWFVVTMALVLLALILVGCMQNRDPSVNWQRFKGQTAKAA